MKRFLALALVASLSACATTAPSIPASTATPLSEGPAAATPLDRADAALIRAEAAYARVRGWSDVLIAALPTTYAARLIAIRDACDRALAAARAAVTLAQRAAALKTLEAEVRRLATESGAPG